MLSAIAAADYTVILRRIITPVISCAKGPAMLILSTMLTLMDLNTVAADPYVSIVLVARMFRKEYATERLKPVTLSTNIADSGTVFSSIFAKITRQVMTTPCPSMVRNAEIYLDRN